MKIIIGCQKNDNLQNLCKDFFGSENIEILNRNGILSLDEVAIIISVVDLTVATISFLYSVLADWNQESNPYDEGKAEDAKDKEMINPFLRRVLITKEGDINLEGYSIEEVERILKLKKELE